MKLKQEAAEVLKLKAVMSVSDRVQAVSDKVEDCLTINNLWCGFLPGVSWKASLG